MTVGYGPPCNKPMGSRRRVRQVETEADAGELFGHIPQALGGFGVAGFGGPSDQCGVTVQLSSSVGA